MGFLNLLGNYDSHTRLYNFSFLRAATNNTKPKSLKPGKAMNNLRNSFIDERKLYAQSYEYQGKKHKQFKFRYIRPDTRHIIDLTIPFSVDIINADYFTLDSKRIK